MIDDILLLQFDTCKHERFDNLCKIVNKIYEIVHAMYKPTKKKNFSNVLVSILKPLLGQTDIETPGGSIFIINVVQNCKSCK